MDFKFWWAIVDHRESGMCMTLAQATDRFRGRSTKERPLFFCPGCEESAVLAIRTNRNHEDYFRHKNSDVCRTADAKGNVTSETPEHYRAKHLIGQQLTRVTFVARCRLGCGSVMNRVRFDDRCQAQIEKGHSGADTPPYRYDILIKRDSRPFGVVEIRQSNACSAAKVKYLKEQFGERFQEVRATVVLSAFDGAGDATIELNTISQSACASCEELARLEFERMKLEKQRLLEEAKAQEIKRQEREVAEKARLALEAQELETQRREQEVRLAAERQRLLEETKIQEREVAEKARLALEAQELETQRREQEVRLTAERTRLFLQEAKEREAKRCEQEARLAKEARELDAKRQREVREAAEKAQCQRVEKEIQDAVTLLESGPILPHPGWRVNHLQLALEGVARTHCPCHGGWFLQRRSDVIAERNALLSDTQRQAAERWMMKSPIEN